MNNVYIAGSIIITLLGILGYVVKGTAVLVRMQTILEGVISHVDRITERQDAMEKRELDDAIRRAQGKR